MGRWYAMVLVLQIGEGSRHDCSATSSSSINIGMNLTQRDAYLISQDDDGVKQPSGFVEDKVQASLHSSSFPYKHSWHFCATGLAAGHHGAARPALMLDICIAGLALHADPGRFGARHWVEGGVRDARAMEWRGGERCAVLLLFISSTAFDNYTSSML